MPDCSPNVFGLIPAAGISQRMGTPKQLLRYRHSTILETVIDSMLRAEPAGLVVVTNSAISARLQLHQRSGFVTTIMKNPEAEMLDSIINGISKITTEFHPTDDDAFIVCPGDIPSVTSELISGCISEYRRHPGNIVVATCKGKRGHPIVVPLSLRSQLEQLHGVGLKGLLRDHVELLREYPAVEGEMMDVDTPNDYQLLLQKEIKHSQRDSGPPIDAGHTP